MRWKRFSTSPAPAPTSAADLLRGLPRRIGAGLVRSFFPSRRIIIISESGVRHYPLAARFQVALLLGAAVVIGWGGYAAGNFGAMQTKVHQAHQRVEDVVHQSRTLSERLELLRHDLSNLSADAEAVNPDVRHQLTESIEALTSATGYADGTAAVPADRPLLTRLATLEGQLRSIQDQHLRVLANLHVATEGKIEELTQVIRMTGLDVSALEHARMAADASPANRLAYAASQAAPAGAAVPAPVLNPVQNSAAAAAHKPGPQGGPYIPASLTDRFMGAENALFEAVNRWQALENVVETLPLGMPMKQAERTSGFGYRLDPFTRRPALHNGMDFAGAHGAPVYATGPGRVIFTGRKLAYGNVVDIDHGHGITTRYAHLHRITVQNGQQVARGTMIGAQGNTGRSTGSHLHYEVRRHDKPLNPKHFVEAGRHVLQKQ